MSKDGGPAFPQMQPDKLNEEGMTLRDFFAAQAIQSLLVRCLNDIGIMKAQAEQENMSFAEYTARAAYQYADAMIAERGKSDS